MINLETLKEPERTAACLQQGYAGRQGVRLRRARHRQGVS